MFAAHLGISLYCDLVLIEVVIPNDEYAELSSRTNPDSRPRWHGYEAGAQIVRNPIYIISIRGDCMDVVGLAIGTARVARVLQNPPSENPERENDTQVKDSLTVQKPRSEEDERG